MGSYNLLRPGNLLRLFAAMAALAFVLRLAGPYLISSEQFEREIEARLSGWTEARLSFSGAPSFAFWPHPRMEFEGAHLRNPDLPENEGADLLTAEHVSVGFSIVGSLFGTPDLGEIEFVRPVFHLRRDAKGAFNWQWNGKTGEAIAGSGAQPRKADAPPDFGTVIVRDGTVVVDDLARAEHYRITNIEGKVDWPEASSNLDVSLQGMVGGEVASWRLSADEPLALLEGHTAAVHTSLRSDPLTIDFNGSANLSKGAFAAGRIRLATPSLGQLLAWRGVSRPHADKSGMTIEGMVTASGYTARLDSLALGIQGSKARGVLDVNLPPQGAPRIGGTLAFDRIDLASLIEALAPRPAQDDDSLEPAAISGIDLDLRLSADEASIEPLVLSDFAAGVRATDGRASLDIGDAAVLGGRVSGRLALNDQELKPGGELQLSLADVDLGALVALSGISGPLPHGRGSADIELFAERPTRELDKAGLAGMFALHFDQGVIVGFDPAAFQELAHGSAPFSMKKAAGGSFAFTAASLEGRIDHGLAELSRGTFEGTEKTLSVSGMIPYRGGNVAMAGSIQERQGEDPAVVRPTVNFLVGGAWAELVISPLKALTDIPAN